MREKDVRRLLLVLLTVTLFSLWSSAVSVLHLDAAFLATDSTTLPKQAPFLHHQQQQEQPYQPYQRLQHQNEQSSGTKPVFLLHVGPPKTATTTIQCGLDALSGKLAEEDFIYFVGKRCPKSSSSTINYLNNQNSTNTNFMANGEAPIPGHHLMMGLGAANPHSRGYEKLQERMEYHRIRGHHMIFSIEAMSNHLEDRPDTWDMFLSLFEKGWHVRVVVAYRHYYDWIRSMYFQQHIGKKYREKWPGIQNGLIHPAFQDFLQYHLERWEQGNPSNDGQSWGQHLSLYALQYFSKHFSDVQVFDLHQTTTTTTTVNDTNISSRGHQNDTLTNFICQMMPEAIHTCQYLLGYHQDSAHQNNYTIPVVQRESHSFDADRLAVAAHRNGILNPKNIGRSMAVRQIREHMIKEIVEGQDQQNNNISIPMSSSSSTKIHTTCLSHTLSQQFLNASLWFEEQVAIFQQNRSVKSAEERREFKTERKSSSALDAFFHRSKMSHVESFQKAMKAKKFCEIDPEATLLEAHWKDFFKRMQGKKGKT